MKTEITKKEAVDPEELDVTLQVTLTVRELLVLCREQILELVNEQINDALKGECYPGDTISLNEGCEGLSANLTSTPNADTEIKFEVIAHC